MKFALKNAPFVLWTEFLTRSKVWSFDLQNSPPAADQTGPSGDNPFAKTGTPQKHSNAHSSSFFKPAYESSAFEVGMMMLG